MERITINLKKCSEGWRAELMEDNRIIDVVTASEINSLFVLLRAKVIHLEYQHIEDASHTGSFTLW